jgi:hypothetical protein
MIGLGEIARATGGRLGTFDVACPLCGPFRHSPVNRRRPVMRVWHVEPGFATFHCCRCGERGHARDKAAPKPDPPRLARARKEIALREREATAERLHKAAWLWSQRKPIAGSQAERYLREARAYGGPLPPTVGFLPGRDEYPPAMIAAFGIAEEREPGIILIRDSAIRGVHLTRLRADGSAKAGSDNDKIMIGCSAGSPIVLAPVNDLCGLAVAEGIEDVLSVHEACGLGGWAAGCASRLPTLADVIPYYVETVTISVDDDPAGRRHATELAERIRARGIEARLIVPGASLRGQHECAGR